MNDHVQTPAEVIIEQQARITELEAPSRALPGSSPGLEFYGDIDALFTSLAKATPEFGDVSKGKEGQIGHQMFKYATLHMLRSASMPALSKHGISCSQWVIDAEDSGMQQVVTMLIGHGGRVISRLTYNRPDDIKDVGKISTYVRRYQYQAQLGLDGGEDADNGDAPPRAKQTKSEGRRPNGQERSRQAPAKGKVSARATKKDEQPPPPNDLDRLIGPPSDAPSGEVPPPGREAPAVTTATVVMITDEQSNRLRTLCVDKGIDGSKAAELSQEIGGAKPGDLTTEQADKLITHLAAL